jgi:anti-sigma-K factor RskA
MKTKPVQELLLLAQTGELDEAQRARLETMLAEDKEARTYRDDLDRIFNGVRSTPMEQDVNPFVLKRIESQARAHTEGGRQGARRGGEVRMIQMWRPAIASAVAAVLLLFFGMTFIRQQKAETAQAPPVPATSAEVEMLAWDVGLDADIEDLNEILAMAGDGIEGMDDLVNELIRLEGLSI